MLLTLYSNYVNSAGERVRIAMALKKLSYTHVSVGHIGWEAFREINPQRLMPALEVDGHIIQQATAILEWLEETHPERPLLPSDPILRAQARRFAQHIVSEMHAIDVIRCGGSSRMTLAWTSWRSTNGSGTGSKEGSPRWKNSL